MPALSIQVSDALTSLLNDGVAPGSPLNAVRDYVHRVNLEELTGRLTTVMPAELATEIIGRGTLRNEIEVHVALQQKLTGDPSTDKAQCDVQMEVIEALRDFIAMDANNARELKFASGEAVCVGAEHMILWLPEHLTQYRVFTSVLRTLWRISR